MKQTGYNGRCPDIHAETLSMSLTILTNPLGKGDPLQIEENGVVRRFKAAGLADYGLAHETHIRVSESGVPIFNPQVKSPLPSRISAYFQGGAGMGAWGIPYEYEENKPATQS
jgi:hypothetical protein